MTDMHFSISAKALKRAKWLTYTVLILLLTSQLFLPPGSIWCRLWPCGMSSSEPRSVALRNVLYLSLGTLAIPKAFQEAWQCALLEAVHDARSSAPSGEVEGAYTRVRD